MKPAIVLKLGGELLEERQDLERIARGIADLSKHATLIVVHGGGKEIDVALGAAGIPKVQVDGLRVTDDATLEIVIAVLAGTVNTRLVAAVRRAGGKPVGLTGADAGVVTLKRAAPLTSVTGRKVSLGLVGSPIHNGAPNLLAALLADGYVPVVACVGVSRDGELLNINADTLAAHLAVSLRVRRLILAGGTTGVLDAEGRTIPRLDARGAARLIRQGTANAGMVAKLQACRTALRGGVKDVLIVNGRQVHFRLLAEKSKTRTTTAGTQVVA